MGATHAECGGRSIKDLFGLSLEIVRMLGRGANGIVYEARDRTTTLRVALKTLVLG
jgi:serine/threonine protein kinase